MFNNFTGDNEYQCCNVIVGGKEERGPLLLGDFNSAMNEQIIKFHKIKTIITAAIGLEHLEIPSTITHIVYPLKDSKTQNISLYFQECFKTIEKKLEVGGVLVHCSAGISRSAALVIAYMMKKNQISFRSAIRYVRSRRNGVCPNLGFQLQLKEYEKLILGDLSLHITKKKIEKRKDSSYTNSQHLPFQSEKKQIENHSMFNIDLLSSKHQNLRKFQGYKTSTKAYNFKPKSRSIFEQDSQLFVSGTRRALSVKKQPYKVKHQMKF